MTRPRLSVEDIFVLIPALNEAGSIGTVVQRLKAVGCAKIRVVDNGSDDGTPVAAGSAGAEVIHEPVRGYGMACWRGLQDLPANVRWLLFCDGDGCDEIEALPRFIDAANRGADLVLGDRLTAAGSRAALTIPQRFGNRLATFLIRVIWGKRFRDLGPMRLIHRNLLEEIDMQDRGFGWTVEMQIRAAQLEAPYEEIPVRYAARRHGRSKISGTVKGVAMAGTTILATIARHAWNGTSEARNWSRRTS
jgi:glycosyltransferase involved in cell wall biosynthesis